MKKRYLVFLVLSLFFSNNISAQFSKLEDDDELEKEQKLFFGINAGAHFANKESALLYTGSLVQPGFNQTRLLSILDNQFIRTQIIDHLNITDFAFVEYAQDMRYRPSVQLGLNLGYTVTQNLLINFDVNFTQIRLADFFNIRLLGNSSTLQQDLFRCEIIGREQRLFLSLGAQYNIREENAEIWSFVEGGGSFVYAGADQSFFRVGDLQYDLINFQAPNQALSNPVDQSQYRSTTLGLYGGVGLGGHINEKVDAYLGLRANYVSINLIPESAATLHYDLYLRFVLR